ncbi:MAG: single-stranded-DNA-specific exonuclease RecJ [Paludibacteraceae bacterium]|jgi:single-stranded-DNA-specific exonuclease|nr:single-stranded-DNA-specific exonuclease RecJ [Paludibacteraceae bacterium]MEE0912438.1 single-stranded-DNA-specific exonuclease RecJ [Paludibacteraceae bacterium]
MVSKWNFIPLTPEQEKQKQDLSEALGISPILCQLLVQRGITTFSEAKSFFRPQLTELYDPFLMNDMDKAVDRLNQAIGRKEKILVYGDYDVDGITAVALVYKFLRKFFCSKSQVDFYIPDRYTEGYGVSYQGIDYAAKNKFNLVIALDCGIKAVEKVEYANSLGVDFIICDHHTPDDTLPNAVAVLDPKRVDSTYPDSNLSGCGVGFKLMQAFAQNNNIEFESLIPLLDLLAVSIASDIVPINGENRILAYYGLKQLNMSPCVGMKSIIDVCGLTDKEISVSDIVFKIGPRLNASGRLQSAKEAVKLLIIPEESTADRITLEKMAEKIDQYNLDRKKLDKNITEEATEELENADDFNTQSSIVVYNPNWHKGVVGIVASRLTERYYKPTIVLTHSNGCATGSGRSVQGFDIYKAIESCRDLLENFGGHMYAVGLSMKEENVPEFQRRFEKYVSENLSEEQRLPQIDIDACIDFCDITPKFFRLLKQFSPYGPENMKPIFVTRRTFDYGTSKVVGKEQEHLKLELIDSKSECIMNGIAFGMSEFNDYIKSLNPVDICYSIEENTFNGNTTIQLVIKDIKKSTT